MPKSSRPGKRNQPRSIGREQQPSPATNSVKPLYRSKELSPRARIISLVVGDILCFLIFASVGSGQHGEGLNLLNSVWIALPFLAGWFLIAPWLGAFRADIATQPTPMILRTALAWLASWPVAMLFRWLLVDRVKVPAVTLNGFLSFAFVALAFNMGLFLLWRWPFALNNDLRKRGL